MHEHSNLHALIRILTFNVASPDSTVVFNHFDLMMKESFTHEKTIFDILILFIVVTDISCMVAKASNVNLIRQLNVEQQGSEALKTPKNPSKSASI